MLMERIARVIPATPVALVARAALDLRCEGTTGDLIESVRALRQRLEEEGVPMAMGREFDPHRRARAQLRDDLARTRDLARLEGDLLAGEEAEEIVRLGLERLVRRGALSLRADGLRTGSHPWADDLLAYYARSLAVLKQTDVQALEDTVRPRP